jgi:hypothetical protein
MYEQQKIKLYIFLVLMVYSELTLAYIDPGTGSMLLQSLIASIAMVLGFLVAFWSGIKNFISRIIDFFKNKNQGDAE